MQLLPDTTDSTSRTETDSASTLHSYDMERIRQLAAVIRRKGANKPPVSPSKQSASKRNAKSKRSAKEKDKSKVTVIFFFSPFLCSTCSLLYNEMGVTSLLLPNKMIKIQ